MWFSPCVFPCVEITSQWQFPPLGIIRERGDFLPQISQYFWTRSSKRKVKIMLASNRLGWSTDCTKNNSVRMLSPQSPSAMLNEETPTSPICLCSICLSSRLPMELEEAYCSVVVLFPLNQVLCLGHTGSELLFLLLWISWLQNSESWSDSP